MNGNQADLGDIDESSSCINIDDSLSQHPLNKENMHQLNDLILSDHHQQSLTPNVNNENEKNKENDADNNINNIASQKAPGFTGSVILLSRGGTSRRMAASSNRSPRLKLDSKSDRLNSWKGTGRNALTTTPPTTLIGANSQKLVQIQHHAINTTTNSESTVQQLNSLDYILYIIYTFKI